MNMNSQTSPNLISFQVIIANAFQTSLLPLQPFSSSSCTSVKQTFVSTALLTHVCQVIFVVLFSLTTFYHTWKLIRTRTWYFIPFVIGGFCKSLLISKYKIHTHTTSLVEFIGYIGRAMSSQESPNWTVGPYVMQSLLLLLAPAFFAASIYMILARIILLTDGNSHSIIKLRWVTKVFVAGDVLSFLAQSSGGGLMAKADSQDDAKMGENIIVGGLGIQILVFGFFIIVAGIFNLRIRKVPTEKSTSVAVPWQRHLFVLYAASALIMVRSIFRIIEYVMGGNGVLLQHEYYLYIFDAVLMFLVTVLFIVWHPSNIISKNLSIRHGRDPESGESGVPLEENSRQQASFKR